MSISGLAVNTDHDPDEPFRPQAAGSDLRLERFVEDRAHFTPTSTAVLTESELVTYAELDGRANRYARLLISAGLQPSMRAAICVSRSARMVAAVLGVLKCGATWVPLDPRYPADRLRFIMSDSECRFLLTETGLANVPNFDGGRTLYLDDVTDTHRDTAPRVDTPCELAYVIYTSGTTGRPKGVMITHTNVISYVRALRQALGVYSSDNWLHTASFAFSSCIRQLFLPLYAGAAITIATERHIADPLLLFEFVRDAGVTILDLVPTYWRVCVDALEKAASADRAELLANRVRLLLSASEVLWSDVPRRWLALGHPATLVNMFGQTETAGIVCTHRITAADLADTRIVPVGKPIPGVKARLFDSRHEEVPKGEAGILHVEGPTVGAGYWKLPAQTGESFVQYSPVTGLLYRTGDLVRERPDGELEFLGRGDHQIKIRGHRVEIAEIEASLRSCPGVADAAVTHDEGAGEDVVLTGYVVGRAGSADLGQVRDRLASMLPEYMVPARLLSVAALPLTPNGKIDRKALAARAPRPDRRPNATPPRDMVERALCGLWSEFLGAAEFGVTDDFLTVGGNSILATRLMSRIREVFRVRLPVEAFFRERTIEGIARALRELESAPGNTEKIAGILHRVQSMSPAEAAHVLSEKRQRKLQDEPRISGY